MLLDEDSHLLGTATPLSREADDARPAPAKVQKYLTSLADAYGLPAEVIHAVAQTESGFDTGKVGTVAQPFRAGVFSEGDFASGNKAYGVMQLRDDQIGRMVRAADGSTFQIGDNVKTDWRANARAGVALLNQHYQLATLEDPFGGEQERAQKAYSGYSGGAPSRDRYQQTLPYNDLPAHPEDRAFLQNLQDAPTAPTRQTQSQQQAQGTSQSNAVSSGQSGSSPLPGPLQRLKENPGNLFFGDRGTSNPTPDSSPPRFSDHAPSQGTATRASLQNIIRSFSSPQDAAAQSSTSGFRARIDQLKQNPNNLFFEPFVRGQNFSQINLNFITKNEGGNLVRPYFPGNPDAHPNAGLTIGKGVDLTQNSADDLRRMGVPQSVVDKLVPFFGKNAPDAYKFALAHKNDPPPLTTAELDQLNRAVLFNNFEQAGHAYNEASPTANLRDLPWQAQTVIADLWYNRGDLRVKAPHFWERVTLGKWEDAAHLLENYRTGDKRLDERAKEDGAQLRQALDASLLPKSRNLSAPGTGNPQTGENRQ